MSNSNSVAKPLLKDGKPGTQKAQATQVAHRWETAKLYKNFKGKKALFAGKYTKDFGIKIAHLDTFAYLFVSFAVLGWF